MNGLVERFVRIHPHAPKRGYRVRVYNVYGIPFAEARGWYTVSLREDQFDILRNIRNETDNIDSKPVFDICTAQERKDLLEYEARVAAPKGEQTSEVNLDAAERNAQYLEDRSRGRNTVDMITGDLRRAPETSRAPHDSLDDVRDMAPPVPAARPDAIDGAVPTQKRGRGRPRKALPTDPTP